MKALAGLVLGAGLCVARGLLMTPLLWSVCEVSAQPSVPEGGEAAHPIHVTLDATATYGIGAYSALGAQVHAVGHVPVWNTELATGTFDFGQLLGFQDEPQLFQYDVPEGLDNDAQRLNLWWTLGHSFYIGRYRQSTFGLHLFAGWTHVFSQASMKRDDLAIDASLSDDYGLFNVGGMLKYDYRFSDYVGFDVQAVGPFPVQPSYVTTLFHVGTGLSFYLK